MNQEKISTRLSLADEAAKLGANLAPEKRSRLLVEMANSGAVLKKLRDRKRVREWVALHKDRIPDYGRRYYQKHLRVITSRRNSPEGKAKKAASSKRYQQRPDYRLRRRDRYRANPEPIKAKSRARGQTPEGRARAKKYQSQRRKNNPQIHFANWLRGSVNRSLRRQSAVKGGRTEALVGCSFLELRTHLESQFTDGMSWATRSLFDIDHFVPVSAFDLTDREEQRWAFHWRNMRPMERLSNKSKSDTLPMPLPDWLPTHIAARLIARKAC